MLIWGLAFIEHQQGDRDFESHCESSWALLSEVTSLAYV